ncbi:hypothetical protein NQ314_002711 [Rhamnusium bicolor]|uniref:Uncharacterized protein n=1 Tax=Rhamnusium bicolor TaxID=1586634 RepID=A0AAV8ZP15_9CUCU|nr:hypothetical protein NQ314_002711 [Rhamnusium bicolor]
MHQLVRKLPLWAIIYLEEQREVRGREEEEGEEAPGEETKTSYNINPKYDPPPLKDLLDGSMSFWVHITQYILPQGETIESYITMRKVPYQRQKII